MYCDITDRYFNVFFVEMQLKRENLTGVLWVHKPAYWSPKQPEYITIIF